MATRALPFLAASLFAAFGWSQDAKPTPRASMEDEARRPFVRYLETDDGGQLEVLIATYRREQATVTLVAALHIADAEHYADLQRRFESFEALLYELIADADLRPHPGMELDESDWLTMVQTGMGRGFRLQYQAEGIDYRQDNFVHADMTAEEFDAALETAGTSILGEMLSGEMPETDREAEAKRRRLDLVAAYRSGRGAHEMRIVGARMMAEADPATREPTVIIEGRNEKCLEVLRAQLAADVRKIGIYYGAAHMEHLERRLVGEHGFTKVKEEWVVAWDCSASRFPTVEKGLKSKRYRARRDLAKLRHAVEAWCRAHPGVEPTWEAVRRAQDGGKLPGRADGVDPWEREYVLRFADGAVEVRCLGSDGEADTEDDMTSDPDAASLPERPKARVARLENEVKRLTALTNAKVMHDAVKMYFIRNGQLPASLEDLVDPEAKGGPFLERLEPDPWGNDYCLSGTDQRDFAVLSFGPDGLEGTADDVSSRDRPTQRAKGKRPSKVPPAPKIR